MTNVTNVINKFVSLVATLGLASACTDELPTLGSGGESFEEFMARTPRVPELPGSPFIVEGDLRMNSEEELYQYWSERHAAGALTIQSVNGVDNKWNATDKMNLTYCVSTNFGSGYGAIVAAMESASREWEARANVNFTHISAQDGALCTNTNASVRFNVTMVPSGPNVPAASAPFPNWDRNVSVLTVNQGSLGNTPAGLTGLLGHELGHLLGFPHEHTRPEAPSGCFEGPDWRALTPYDVESIMHYGDCGRITPEWWSPLDRTGAAVVYGAGVRPKADIRWRQTSNGSIAVWLMNGSVAGMGAPIGVGAGWDMVGAGDVNLDRKDDIVWRHTDGRIAVWFMNGATWMVDWVFAAQPASMTPLQVGDFDGDDRSDILWKSGANLVIWYLGGGIGNLWVADTDTVTNVGGSVVAAPTRPILGLGDFDRNGQTDIAWGPSTAVGAPNDVVIWLMNGGTIIGQATLAGDTAQVQAVGDMDGDGRDDLLRRYPDGTLNIWFMKGTVKSSEAWPGTPPLAWGVKGLGDFNGDWRADILWRHTDGTLAIWFMTGGQKLSEGYPGTVANDWVIRGVNSFD